MFWLILKMMSVHVNVWQHFELVVLNQKTRVSSQQTNGCVWPAGDDPRIQVTTPVDGDREHLMAVIRAMCRLMAYRVSRNKYHGQLFTGHSFPCQKKSMQIWTFVPGQTNNFTTRTIISPTFFNNARRTIVWGNDCYGGWFGNEYPASIKFTENEGPGERLSLYPDKMPFYSLKSTNILTYTWILWLVFKITCALASYLHCISKWE